MRTFYLMSCCSACFQQQTCLLLTLCVLPLQLHALQCATVAATGGKAAQLVLQHDPHAVAHLSDTKGQHHWH